MGIFLYFVGGMQYLLTCHHRIDPPPGRRVDNDPYFGVVNKITGENMSYKYILKTAKAGLDANASSVAKLDAAAKTEQYRAVSPTLARLVAKKATCSTHEATWGIVNAYNRYFDVNAENDEEINDF